MRLYWDDNREVKKNELTATQREELRRIHKQYGLTDTVKISRGFSGEVIVQMSPNLCWAIESDGYVHT